MIIKYLYYSMLSMALHVQGQDTLKSPVRGSAFNKQLMQELNFMVLGDNNLNQGLSYELDSKRTELSLKAGISNKRTYIVTVDGSFSVDDGIFILDNEDGSKKGKVTLNLFLPAFAGNYKTFPAVSNHTDSDISNRIRHINYIQEKELKQKAAENFVVLDDIMRIFGFPRSSLQKEKTFFWEGEQALVESVASGHNSVTEEAVVKALLKYYTPQNPEVKFETLRNLVYDIASRDARTVFVTGKEDTLTYDIYEGFDVDSLFSDYNAALTAARDIDDKVDDKQIQNFSDMWLWHNNTYFNISPYYERQSLDTYSSDVMITDFTKRFTEQRGDLYGITGGLNWVKRHREGFFLLARGLATFGRGSNFSDFKKREYLYNSAAEPVGTGTVVEQQLKTAYYTNDGSAYQYGFLQKYQAEGYIAWKVLGIYGKVAYTNNDALAKKETYPLEAGIMINLKSEKKNVVSMLIFMGRDDMAMHPDDDMNIGFKIGLPVNVPKQKDK